MKERIKEIIEHSIQTKKAVLEDPLLLDQVAAAAQICINAYQQDKKVFFCGNGGSAADAQHLACELSGRFYYDRPPLFAEALSVNTSYMTAVANDYSYEEVFARMVQGVCRKGDVLFAISTSGNSPNIIRALEEAQKIGVSCIGFTGKDGGKMNGLCDLLLKIPDTDTPRIQEVHILIGHAICELVEKALFPR